MEVLFEGGLHVHYGQVYVMCGEGFPADPMGGAFGGQSNGLCGAATPDFLFLITGLHTGYVGFTVEFHETAPVLDDQWEEIVEVTFAATEDRVMLVEWAGVSSWPLDVGRGDRRVRYCAFGMDQGRDADTHSDGQPPIDRYLLQFWPAPPAPDRVLKQTSAIAAYWHDHARSIPPPPPPPTHEEIAEAARQAQLESEERHRRFEDELIWGGVRPSERLRAARANVSQLVKLDRALVDAIAEAAPDVQRLIARWAARRACDASGLSSRPWVAPALQALERGDQLPPPFDYPPRVWDLLLGENPVLHAELVPQSQSATRSRRIMPEAAALPSVWAAAEADPLKAALDALAAAAATFRDQSPQLFHDLRLAFPTVGNSSNR